MTFPKSLMARLALLVLAVFLFASTVNAAKCHPTCKWLCDDPTCPAQCHPVCERPRCQMQCEALPAAECTVKCEKPQCSVRCPKELCEKDDCPKCETVCAPAECRTSCVAPEPVCSPLCEETKCDWKCHKPTLCPKPKCELQCEKPACEARPDEPPALEECCPCDETGLLEAMNSANVRSQPGTMAMSLLELQHTTQFNAARGQDMCCPCRN